MIRFVEMTREHLDDVLDDPYNAFVGYSESSRRIFTDHSTSYAMVDEGGRAIFCFGVIKMMGWRPEAWAFFRKNHHAYFLPFVRHVKKLLKDAPFRRIEAPVLTDFLEGHRLANMLGFRCETFRMEKYGITGKDYSMYVMTKEIP
jgi:hypothetical protein